MGAWTASSLLDTGPKHVGWLLILLHFLLQIQGTNSACDLAGCWNLYQLAQETLGVRDDYPVYNRQPNTPPPVELGARCLALRTFYLCLKNMTFSCRSELSFHSAYKGIEQQLKQFNCSLKGSVFNPKDIPETPAQGPSYNTVCTYNKDGLEPVTYYHCALFGDPHLRTFNGEHKTCRLDGAWPLLDNKYLTVQVTNRQVGYLSRTATAITEVTVIIKAHKKCAHDVFVTYQALGGELPSSFNSGHKHLGREHAVTVKEVVANQHIELYLRYIDTTIVIRLVGNHYSVAIKMPQEVVNSTVWHKDSDQLSPAPVQLCANGCPPNHQIAYKEILALAQPSASSAGGSQSGRGSSSPSSSREMFSLDTAYQKCSKAGLVDYFLDSCVFDLMSTGDSNFTQTSLYAYQDSLRLVPELAASHANRTTIDFSEYQPDRTSGATSLHTMMHTFHSILYQSHLNYIHRTTFVLMLVVVHYFIHVVSR